MVRTLPTKGRYTLAERKRHRKLKKKAYQGVYVTDGLFFTRWMLGIKGGSPGAWSQHAICELMKKIYGIENFG